MANQGDYDNTLSDKQWNISCGFQMRKYGWRNQVKLGRQQLKLEGAELHGTQMYKLHLCTLDSCLLKRWICGEDLCTVL